jgi:uncharacterized repeat protein (TIGR01451 family)
MRLRGATTVVVAAALLCVNPLSAIARQVPDPTSTLFIQTSGPNAGISIGDYYTAPAGGNTDHLFILQVPSDWPAGVPVTLALYDPEVAGPDPSSPTSADEVRGAADTATFSLESPGGSTIASAAYSGAATNGIWTALATFDPGVTGTGTYELHVSVSDDDDDSFRIDASHDPDCAVGGPGTCASASLVSGNESDSAPGGSGELGLGVVRTSFQHAGSGQVCQDHIFYVNPSTPRPLRAHNFDMDGSGSVTYTAPTGATTAGTVSNNGAWNNSSNATRVGDVLADINGWWTAHICISSTNQYVFEAPSAGPSFPEPQPTPRLTVDKTDGVAVAGIGDQLTYAITVSNVSDSDPNPGRAYVIELTDALPTDVAFVSCDAPTGITCLESSGVVTATASSPLRPGESFVVEVVVSVDSTVGDTVANTASVTYQDAGGNEFDQVESTDTDEIEFEPVLELVATGPAQVLRGQSATVTFALRHAPSSDGSLVLSPVLDAGACDTLSFTGGDDDSDGNLDSGETWTWDCEILTTASDPDTVPVPGLATGTDRDDDEVTAIGSTTLQLVDERAVAGTAFEDLDGDGIREAGEPAIEGATVRLTDGSTTLASFTTGSNGAYLFDGLFPGDYTVLVDETTLPQGMVATTPVNQAVTLAATEPVDEVDFGFATPVTITGTVFADDDRDGGRDAGDEGIEGVTVLLSGASTDSTVTGADGSYTFTAMPGSFTLAIGAGLPDSWELTTADELATGPLVSGASSSDNDFGAAAERSQDDEDDDDDPTPVDDPDDGGVDDVDELPFTGMNLDGFLFFSIALAGAGAIIIVLGKDDAGPETA